MCGENRWIAYRTVIGADVENEPTGDKELAEALVFFGEIENISGMAMIRRTGALSRRRPS